MTAGTVGGVVDMPRWRRFEIGVGAEITSYVVPEALTRRARRSSGVVSRVSSDPSTGQLDGADVEHADGRTDALLHHFPHTVEELDDTSLQRILGTDDAEPVVLYQLLDNVRPVPKLVC